MKLIKKILSLQPETYFVALALFFGTISAFVVPQLSVNDEGAHLLRSYSITSGDITGYECSYPSELINKVQDSSSSKYPVEYAVKNSQEYLPYSCGSAGAYFPLMHLPQVIGVFIAKILYNSPSALVLLGRLANLLFFTIAMYFIIKKVVIGKWVFFVIGLLPATLHAAASLSYDTFNAVAIFAFVALLLNLYLQKQPLNKKQILLLAALSIFVAASKTTNVVLLPLIFILPKKLFKNPLLRLRWSPATNKILVTFGVLVLSALSIIIWQKLSGAIPTVTSSTVVDENPLYFLVVLYNTYINPFFGYNDILLRGTVGEFSSFKHHLPTFLVIVCYGLITFVLLADDRDSKKITRKNLSWLAVCTVVALVVSILAITYGLYKIWATLPDRFGPHAYFADGVQGRYFTPLFVLLIPFGLWLRKYIRITLSSPQVQKGIIISTSTLLLVFYTLQSILFLIRL